MDKRRQSMLTRSIQSALFRDPETFKKTVTGCILAFFCVFYIRLIRYEADKFRNLRSEIWKIDDEEYAASFRTRDRRRPIQAMGDLGYSGSVRRVLKHHLHSFRY